MPKLARVTPGYRPLLLTTQRLYPRWKELLWNVRVPESRGLIVVLPQDAPRAVAQRYQTRGGSVRIIEEGSGVERYYDMRNRLSAEYR